MTGSRDNFSQDTIRKLGERVNLMCSNPKCGACTKGPHSQEDKSISVGVACHIHAAAEGGPWASRKAAARRIRYCSNLS
jgi:hypothetical protein